MEVRSTAASDLAAPVKLLEESVRDGEALPRNFAEFLRKEIERGNIEVLSALVGDSVVGVALLAFRPSISAGGLFASVEDLYVKPEARRLGVGTKLLEAVEELCTSKNTSYVEVQAVEERAVKFYRSLGYGLEADVRVLARSVPFR